LEGQKKSFVAGLHTLAFEDRLSHIAFSLGEGNDPGPKKGWRWSRKETQVSDASKNLKRFFEKPLTLASALK
jgi:hypothetical protein